MDGKLVLYHGSDHIIEKPEYGKGKTNNDYGRGFYCTCDKELAKEWSCPTMNDGIVNCYSIETTGLRILNLNGKPYNILHWLTILLENRTFDIDTDMGETTDDYLRNNYHIDTSGYDIIIGHRADDSYFLFAKDFRDGAITLNTLSEAMGLGGLGERVFIRSQKAFDRLVFRGYEVTDCNEYHEKRSNRNEAARNLYREMRKSQKVTSEDILAFHITTGQVGKDDPRLQC